MYDHQILIDCSLEETGPESEPESDEPKWSTVLISIAFIIFLIAIIIVFLFLFFCYTHFTEIKNYFSKKIEKIDIVYSEGPVPSTVNKSDQHSTVSSVKTVDSTTGKDTPSKKTSVGRSQTSAPKNISPKAKTT